VGSREEGHTHSWKVHHQLQIQLLFCPITWCGSTSTHHVPVALLSRFFTGCLSLSTDLLYAALLLKVSAPLVELVLGSSSVGSEKPVNMS
jgi:hypothetical protein